MVYTNKFQRSKGLAYFTSSHVLLFYASDFCFDMQTFILELK